jgi:hypothetical protein
MAFHNYKKEYKDINEAKRINVLKPNSITKNPAIIHKDFHDNGLKYMTPPSDLCGFLPPSAAMTE